MAYVSKMVEHYGWEEFIRVCNLCPESVEWLQKVEATYGKNLRIKQLLDVYLQLDDTIGPKTKAEWKRNQKMSLKRDFAFDVVMAGGELVAHDLYRARLTSGEIIGQSRDKATIFAHARQRSYLNFVQSGNVVTKNDDWERIETPWGTKFTNLEEVMMLTENFVVEQYYEDYHDQIKFWREVQL